jgi:hypothetical protein
MMGIGYETRLSQILPKNLEEKEQVRNEFTIALNQDPFAREDPSPDRRRDVILLTSPAATAERGGISGSQKKFATTLRPSLTASILQQHHTSWLSR